MRKKSIFFSMLSLIALLLSLSVTSCSKDSDEITDDLESSSTSGKEVTSDGYEYIREIPALNVYNIGVIYYGKKTVVYVFQKDHSYYYCMARKGVAKKLPANKNYDKKIHGVDVSGYRYYIDYGAALGKYYFN